MTEVSAIEPRDPSAQAEGLYESNYPLLRYVATRRFGIPEDQADDLVHEVFLSYLLHADSIRDPKSWLVGAICNASRQHRRASGRFDQEDPRNEEAGGEPIEVLLVRMEIQNVLRRLHQNCRETLRLHYYSGLSAKEMAQKLATTHRYAEKMIHKCLGRALGILQQLEKVRP